MQGHLSLVSTTALPPTSTAHPLSTYFWTSYLNKILNPLPFILSWTVIFEYLMDTIFGFGAAAHAFLIFEFF